MLDPTERLAGFGTPGGQWHDASGGARIQPMRSFLIALGLLLVAAGLLWPAISRYAGRLPGDVVVRHPGFAFVFPIVTCLVLSLLISLLLWLVRR